MIMGHSSRQQAYYTTQRQHYKITATILCHTFVVNQDGPNLSQINMQFLYVSFGKTEKVPFHVMCQGTF